MHPFFKRSRGRETLSAAVRPVLLAPWGRNGSTYLMSLLGTSPDVLVPDAYPYERHQLLHFLRAAEVLAGASDSQREHQSRLMPGLWDGRLSPVEGLPVAGRQAAMAGDLLAALWRGWTDHLHGEGIVPRTVRYYAEKGTVEVAQALAQRVEGVCIFIARDPRDMVASSKAFNEARGNFEFGWSGSGDVSYLREAFAGLAAQLDLFDALPDRFLKVKIRYEELVVPGGAAVRQVEAALGIRLYPDRVPAAPAGHRTTGSAEASIGRWKRDMSPALAAELRAAADGLFRRLGYD